MPKRQQFAVIGLGLFGTAVCRTLHELGHEVLAIDADEQIVRVMHEDGLATHVVQADALSPVALRELDMPGFDAVIVAIGTNIEASMLTVLNLLDLGVKKVVAKAVHSRHAQILERIGQNQVRVVMPEAEMGARIAQLLLGHEILESVVLDPLHSFAEMPVPGELVGRTLAEAGLLQRLGLLVIAIRHGSELKISPGGSTRLQAGDQLVLLGPNKGIGALQP